MRTRVSAPLSRAPVLIVGAGLAGLCAALAAQPAPVLLLDRSPCAAEDVNVCASSLAQGGIAAALGADDCIAAHITDTLNAGANHNELAAVEYLCQQAPAAIRWLQDQGVVFDSEGDGLAFATEGGHGRARVVHVGGDASGANILAVLRRRVQASAQIEWRRGVEVDALLIVDGEVVGVRVRRSDGGFDQLTGIAVILATGGIGGLFAATSNPEQAQGQGLALALAVGAHLRDLALIQFHPTALAVRTGVRLPLLTEALRGVGARLRDGQGIDLMAGVHPLGDLAPRDVVARQVQLALQAGRGAFLHAQHLDLDWPHAFPTAWTHTRAHGFNPSRDALPIVPAAHFHMGGIAVDLDGRSTVPGLYAVGEVACNAVHGGNRLASNSLLECVVFGRRVGGAAANRRPLRNVEHAPVDAVAFAGAELPTATLSALRECLSDTLGPLRRFAQVQKVRNCLARNRLLVNSAPGRVALALLDATLGHPQNLGAHFWQGAAIDGLAKLGRCVCAHCV